MVHFSSTQQHVLIFLAHCLVLIEAWIRSCPEIQLNAEQSGATKLDRVLNEWASTRLFSNLFVFNSSKFSINKSYVIYTGNAVVIQQGSNVDHQRRQASTLTTITIPWPKARYYLTS